MKALSQFCCQNKKCPDYGKHGANNLTVCGWYGKKQPHSADKPTSKSGEITYKTIYALLSRDDTEETSE